MYSYSLNMPSEGMHQMHLTEALPNIDEEMTCLQMPPIVEGL